MYWKHLVLQKKNKKLPTDSYFIKNYLDGGLHQILTSNSFLTIKKKETYKHSYRSKKENKLMFASNDTDLKKRE